MTDNNTKDSSRHLCVYNKEWEKLYPITDVKSDRYAFYCVPCARTISCADKGLRNVRRHCETSMHSKTITNQMLGTNIPSLSVIHPLGLSLNKSLSTTAKGILNSTTSSNTNNQSGPPAPQFTPRSRGPDCLPKLVKTLNLQNSEKKFNINSLDDNLNEMELLEKYKFAYGLARKVEADFILAMGPSNDRIPQRIADELKFLDITLKHLKNTIN